MNTPFSKLSLHRCRLAAQGILAFHLFVSVASGAAVPLDSKDSSLTFTGEATLHKFHGEAKEFSGKAEFDKSSATPIQKATLQFETAALTTFHRERDQKMREWLHVEVHPEATFQLQGVKQLSGDYKTANSARPAKFAVSGILTLNGVKRPLSGIAFAWREGNRIIVTGQTTVDTLNFGLPQIKQALVMTVATDVQITYRFSFEIAG